MKNMNKPGTASSSQTYSNGFYSANSVSSQQQSRNHRNMPS